MVPGQRRPGGRDLPRRRRARAAGAAGTRPARFLAVRCDVTDPAQVEAAFAAVEERWGPVEVLVANAGITRDTLVLRMGEEAWHEVIDTNLTGVFRVAKRALAKMLRLHRGRIIFVSSVGAFIGSPGQANYAASKAGLVGMARSLAREVASRSITVNVVAPGLVDDRYDRGSRRGTDRADAGDGAAGPRRQARRRWPRPSGSWPRRGRATSPGAVLPVDGGLGMGL